MPAITTNDLNNAKADVDHIAAIATSLENTTTDRLGNVKQTMTGAIGAIAGITNRGAWVTAIVYGVKDIVLDSGTWYICVVAHTSGATFAGDSAAKWRVYQGVIAVDLANSADTAKGASLVGYLGGTLRAYLNQLVTSAGASLIGWIQAGTGAVLRLVQDKLRDTVSTADFGALPDGSDAGAKINAAIDALYAAGGGVLEALTGTYVIETPIILKTGIVIRGKGYGTTIFKLKTGVNTDVVKTTGYGTFTSLSDAGVPRDFGIEQLTIDGNYLASAWNSATNTINNSTGYGIKCEGYGFNIDVELINIPEVGCRIAGEGSQPTTQDVFSTVSVFGRVFGKEGLIVTGPNDFIIRKAFLGLCGILSRPSAETTFSTSTEYAGDPVDGIVFDGVNVEVGEMHVYACWSGIGLRTRNTVRLEGTHIISESNNGQVSLSSNTYGGCALMAIRNLSLHHPDWTAATPAYASPNDRWDGVTIASAGYLIGSLKIFRTISAITRVAGTNALVISGSENVVGLTFANSTAPVGDAEAGARYSGDVALISGDHNVVNGGAANCRGKGFNVTGNYNFLNATVRTPIGYGVYAAGSYNQITATSHSQTQNAGVGSAFYNGGSLNIWNTVSHNNAVPYSSALALGRTAGNRLNATVRSFTVATGAITVTTFDDIISVDTEAAAATDDLDTITGGALYQRLTLSSINSGQDVTAKDGTGNLRLAGDFIVSHPQDRLVIEYDGTNWCEISRADNTA